MFAIEFAQKRGDQLCESCESVSAPPSNPIFITVTWPFEKAQCNGVHLREQLNLGFHQIQAVLLLYALGPNMLQYATCVTRLGLFPEAKRQLRHL